VLALRADAASDRFDALLAELTAGGLLDPAAARELRWWQRESVRAVGDHLVDTVPASLVALDRAKAAAVEATAMADLAWNLATPSRPSSEDPQDPSLVVDLRGDESDDESEENPASRDGEDTEEGKEEDAEPQEQTGETVGREEQNPVSPLTSTRRRLLVAGLSVLPDRPAP
jgi:hypothetical protein